MLVTIVLVTSVYVLRGIRRCEEIIDLKVRHVSENIQTLCDDGIATDLHEI